QFRQNKQAEVIAVYLEEIADGQRLMEVVSRLALNKPVIVLKAGLTEEGSRASLSHTGSMAGSRQATLTGLRRAGALVAESLEDFFNLIELFGKKKDIPYGDIFIISNAGGPLVVAADEISKYGLTIGKWGKDTQKKLEKVLPSATPGVNPLDIIGDADAARYKQSLETVLKDKNVRQLLVLLTPQSATQIRETAQEIALLSKKYSRKLILTSFIGGSSLSEARKILEKSSALHYEYPVQAIRNLSKLNRFRCLQYNLKPYTSPSIPAKEPKQQQKDYIESLNLLKEYRIPVVETFVIHHHKDLDSLSYPIVLKAVGPDIVHKTDKKFIVLNIANKTRAKAVRKEFQENMGENDYCVAQSMVSDGTEMLVGFKRDEKFGTIIMAGAGGIYTEILEDVQTEVDDVNTNRAKQMVQNLRIYPLLRGARSNKKLAVPQVVQAIVNIARLARENPQISELDINPLFVTQEGVKAGDVRIIE
ncbi:MAG TPA: acetate--CoA ligase family protein, partial [Patescibacteria group bacterium]|nr:acetate--CoA ligase family protein [Patescibacteria group bacterium]